MKKKHKKLLLHDHCSSLWRMEGNSMLRNYHNVPNKKEAYKYGVVEFIKNHKLLSICKNANVLLMADVYGKIDFPGGKREVGESLFQCVVRELEEETSIVLKGLKKEHCKEKVIKYNHYFLLISIQLKSDNY